MRSDTDISSNAAGLRDKAEQLILEAESESPDRRRRRRGDDTLKLVHELQVHQIELEMQNTELRLVRDDKDKAETALNRYTDLYDFAPVGYFTLDRAGVIVAVNLRGADLLKRVRSKLLGRRFGQSVASEFRPAFALLLEKVFAGRDTGSCEVELLTADKSPLFVQIEAVASGTGQECRIALIDTTERRRAEAALAEKKRELEEINRSMAARIVRAVDELREKDKMLFLLDRRALMGEMINFIAHQWRQPLNTLGLVIQKLPLLHDAGKLNGEILKESVGDGMRMLQQMSRTIDDFRNFFKTDKEAVSFSVKRIIASTLSLIEKSFKEQRIRIVLDLEGDPLASGYPNEYAQVLLNILMNAHDALLGHNVEDALISIRASAEGDHTVVTITDNAGGITDENIGKLFDPYFTTKGPEKGTGIGLFMAKTIIEDNMEGSISVRNTGNGAEFRIVV